MFNKVFDQGKKVIEGPDIALIGYDNLPKLKWQITQTLFPSGNDSVAVDPVLRPV
jgi:hypothetical protein